MSKQELKYNLTIEQIIEIIHYLKDDLIEGKIITKKRVDAIIKTNTSRMTGHK